MSCDQPGTDRELRVRFGLLLGRADRPLGRSLVLANTTDAAPHDRGIPADLGPWETRVYERDVAEPDADGE